jgi:hypothetical protein
MNNTEEHANLTGASGHRNVTLAIHSLTLQSLAALAAVHSPPCLSLYQPTHRHHPENQQDPIRYGNLVKKLEASLQQRYSGTETKRRLASFEALAHDREFWMHALDGLAVLGGTGMFQVFRLQQAVAEQAIVADSFHTRPLRRYLQSAGRYQVLGLSLHRIQLFEGDRNALDEIAPATEAARTIAEAFGNTLTEPYQSVASYGSAGGVGRPSHHSQGGPKNVADADAERFFRAIDRAVLEHHSRPSGLPLMLASLPDHQHLFRQVSHNPFLVTEGLLINPDVLPNDTLRERAWQIFEPHYAARLTKWADEFAVAKANGLGVDDLAQVAEAAVAGRVAVLLIEDERQIPGRIDTATGQVRLGDLGDPEVNDALDDLGQLVFDKGGRVILVPSGQMPTKTGTAAVFRF